MKVSEVNKILKDNKMQNKNTNFKIVEKKLGSRSKRSIKPTTKDLILQLMKRFDNLVKKNNLKE